MTRSDLLTLRRVAALARELKAFEGSGVGGEGGEKGKSATPSETHPSPLSPNPSFGPEHVPLAVLMAAVNHATECSEWGDDPRPGLAAIQKVLQNPHELARITGMRPHAAQKAYEVMFEKGATGEHAIGQPYQVGNNRWMVNEQRGGKVRAIPCKNPNAPDAPKQTHAAAAQQATSPRVPGEPANLPPVDGKNPANQATREQKAQAVHHARTIGVKAMADPRSITADDVHLMIAHLPHLNHKELSYLRTAFTAMSQKLDMGGAEEASTFGNKRRLEDRKGHIKKGLTRVAASLEDVARKATLEHKAASPAATPPPVGEGTPPATAATPPLAEPEPPQASPPTEAKADSPTGDPVAATPAKASPSGPRDHDGEIDAHPTMTPEQKATAKKFMGGARSPAEKDQLADQIRDASPQELAEAFTPAKAKTPISSLSDSPEDPKVASQRAGGPSRARASQGNVHQWVGTMNPQQREDLAEQGWNASKGKRVRPPAWVHESEMPLFSSMMESQASKWGHGAFHLDEPSPEDGKPTAAKAAKSGAAATGEPSQPRSPQAQVASPEKPVPPPKNQTPPVPTPGAAKPSKPPKPMTLADGTRDHAGEIDAHPTMTPEQKATAKGFMGQTKSPAEKDQLADQIRDASPQELEEAFTPASAKRSAVANPAATPATPPPAQATKSPPKEAGSPPVQPTPAKPAVPATAPPPTPESQPKGNHNVDALVEATQKATKGELANHIRFGKVPPAEVIAAARKVGYSDRVPSLTEAAGALHQARDEHERQHGEHVAGQFSPPTGEVKPGVRPDEKAVAKLASHVASGVDGSGLNQSLKGNLNHEQLSEVGKRLGVNTEGKNVPEIHAALKAHWQAAKEGKGQPSKSKSPKPTLAAPQLDTTAHHEAIEKAGASQANTLAAKKAVATAKTPAEADAAVKMAGGKPPASKPVATPPPTPATATNSLAVDHAGELGKLTHLSPEQRAAHAASIQNAKTTGEADAALARARADHTTAAMNAGGKPNPPAAPPRTPRNTGRADDARPTEEEFAAASKPASKPTGKPAPARHEIHAALRDAIDASQGLSDEQRAHYKQAVDRVAGSLPKAAHDRIAKHMKKATFHPDTKELGKNAMASVLASAKTSKERELWERLNAKLISGKTHAGGMFHGDSGQLHVDGTTEGTHLGRHGHDGLDAHGVYSHELGHAIDGPKHEFSGSDDWRVAFNSELAFAGHEHAPLTEYAGSSPSEGFAEFSRLVHGSDVPHSQIAREFPKAAKFFKDKKIWPETERAGPESKMPAQFNERLSVDGGGDHIDAVTPEKDDEYAALSQTSVRNNPEAVAYLEKAKVDPATRDEVLGQLADSSVPNSWTARVAIAHHLGGSALAHRVDKAKTVADQVELIRHGLTHGGLVSKTASPTPPAKPAASEDANRSQQKAAAEQLARNVAATNAKGTPPTAGGPPDVSTFAARAEAAKADPHAANSLLADLAHPSVLADHVADVARKIGGDDLAEQVENADDRAGEVAAIRDHLSPGARADLMEVGSDSGGGDGDMETPQQHAARYRESYRASRKGASPEDRARDYIKASSGEHDDFNIDESHLDDKTRSQITGDLSKLPPGELAAHVMNMSTLAKPGHPAFDMAHAAADEAARKNPAPGREEFDDADKGNPGSNHTLVTGDDVHPDEWAGIQKAAKLLPGAAVTRAKDSLIVENNSPLHEAIRKQHDDVGHPVGDTGALKSLFEAGKDGYLNGGSASEHHHPGYEVETHEVPESAKNYGTTSGSNQSGSLEEKPPGDDWNPGAVNVYRRLTPDWAIRKRGDGDPDVADRSAERYELVHRKSLQKTGLSKLPPAYWKHFDTEGGTDDDLVEANEKKKKFAEVETDESGNKYNPESKARKEIHDHREAIRNHQKEIARHKQRWHDAMSDVQGDRPEEPDWEGSKQEWDKAGHGRKQRTVPLHKSLTHSGVDDETHQKFVDRDSHEAALRDLRGDYADHASDLAKEVDNDIKGVAGKSGLRDTIRGHKEAIRKHQARVEAARERWGSHFKGVPKEDRPDEPDWDGDVDTDPLDSPEKFETRGERASALADMADEYGTHADEVEDAVSEATGRGK